MSASNRELGELGPYSLIDQIAVGGMAEIYLAKTRGVAGFEKFLCLKVIHPNYADDEHFIEMLIDEAKIAVGLNHVNIVHIFDLGRDGRTYFIAMEYIDGADLFKIMRRLSERDIDLSIDVAAYIAQEICSGLDYAHRKRDEQGRPLGIIHRDISPQNILLSHSGEVKIVDFGIAKAASRSRKTQAGVIKGKYYYMSPEQAWGDPVDQRTDIFSCGIILYEVLTGQMLYLEEDMHRLLDMVRKADIPRPSTRRAEVPPQLETIVMKALAKRPADRWQTAHEFQAALTNFLFSYAPDFTPTRVCRLLETAMADAPAPVARTRPPTKQVQLEKLMSKLDFRPQTEHSVIFPVSDLMEGEDPTSESGEEIDEIDEEDRGERTQISGPPSMMDPFRPAPVSGFREALPIKSYREAIPTTGWEELEGPTLLNQSNPPLRLQDEALPRPRRQSRSIPVEIVVPRPLAPAVPVPLAPEVISGDFTPTMQMADEPTKLEQNPLRARPATARPAQRSQEVARLRAPAPAASRPPPIPPPPPAVRPRAMTGPARRPPSAAWPPLPALAPGASPRMEAAAAAALPQPPAPVAGPPQVASPPIPAAPTGWPWAPPQQPPMVQAPVVQPQAPQPIVTPLSGPGYPASWPPAPLPPVQASPSQGWPQGWSLGSTPAPFGSPAPELDQAGLLVSRRRRRWRRNLAVFLFLSLIVAGAAMVILFLVPPSEEGGKINVISVPEGASVIFDGRLQPKPAPVVIAVSELNQEHTIEVQLKNYRPYQRKLSFSEGESSVQVLAVLTPIFGRLEVRSTPEGADVYVDNTHRGRTPLVIENLTPTGEVTVELRRRGYRPLTNVLRWEDRTYLVWEAGLQRSQ